MYLRFIRIRKHFLRTFKFLKKSVCFDTKNIEVDSNMFTNDKAIYLVLNKNIKTIYSKFEMIVIYLIPYHFLKIKIIFSLN